MIIDSHRTDISIYCPSSDIDILGNTGVIHSIPTECSGYGIDHVCVIVGHPERDKKKSVGIFEYILASMLKVCLGVF